MEKEENTVKLKKNSHKVWKEHYTTKALEKYSQEK